MKIDFDLTEERAEQKRLTKGFEFYTQSSTEHLEEGFVALNNRFPNLLGYGIVQFLKQLMAQQDTGKLTWDEDNIDKIANLMAIDKSLLLEVVGFCTKSLKMMKVTTYYQIDAPNKTMLVFPKFLDHLIELQVKRKMEHGLFYQQQIIKPSTKETPAKLRTRLVAEIKAVLELTQEEKTMRNESVNKYYQGLNPDTAWSEFERSCCNKYLEWHETLTKENKLQSFYMYLNNKA